MSKLFRYILQCAIILLLTHPAGAKAVAVHGSEDITRIAADATQHVPSYLGVMYEAGRYPGRHKQFIHKKLVPSSPAFTAVAMWVLQPRIPSFIVYYFSSLYRSHISAILNSNDLLRGPPVATV